MLRAVGICRVVVDHFPASRDPSPVFLPLIHVGEAGLKALEKRVRVVIFGNVLEHVVGHIGQGTVMDFRCGEPGPDKIGRSGPRPCRRARLPVLSRRETDAY